MRSKILVSVLVIALAAALLAGATGAWFTGEADLDVATFTAGTVEIDVSSGPNYTPMEGRSVDNVNPGDCATVCWDIENTGTKSAELRVKIESGFSDNLPEENVAYYAPAPGTGWDMYKDDEGIMWLYYAEGPVAGTYTDESENSDPEVVELCLVVAFDGPAMNNDYKGASYTISGEVQAIQSTNDAMEFAVGWGLEWMSEDNKYTESINYMVEKGVSCWTGEEPGQCEVTVVVLERFEITEGGYQGGAGFEYENLNLSELVTSEVTNGDVKFTQTASDDYVFDGWYSAMPGHVLATDYLGNAETYTTLNTEKTIYAVFRAKQNK